MKKCPLSKTRLLCMKEECAWWIIPPEERILDIPAEKKIKLGDCAITLMTEKLLNQ